MPICVPEFTGDKGPTAARIFAMDMDAAMTAGGFKDEKMAGVFKSKMKDAARVWLMNQMSLATPGFDKWSTIRPHFEAEFMVPLTIAQLDATAKTLQQKQSESISIFFNRVQAYHLDADFPLTPEDKAKEGYRDGFDRRVQMSFLQGIRRQILQNCTGVDLNTATLTEIIAAAKSAETRLMCSTGAQAATTTAPTDAVQQEKTAFMEAAIAVLDKRMAEYGLSRRNGGGGNSNNGSNRGGNKRQAGTSTSSGTSNSSGGGRRFPNNAPREQMMTRPRTQCPHCNKWGRHLPEECEQNPNKRGTGSATYGSSYANAVAGAFGDMTPFDTPGSN